MLRTAVHPALLNADAAALPVQAGAFDGLAADYVASLASHYHDEVARPWPEVVEDVRRDVQAVIDRDGAFITSGDLAGFVCR